MVDLEPILPVYELNGPHGLPSIIIEAFPNFVNSVSVILPICWTIRFNSYGSQLHLLNGCLIQARSEVDYFVSWKKNETP